MPPSAVLRRLAGLFCAGCLAAPLQAMIFSRIEPVALPGDEMRPSQMILGSGPITPGETQVF